MTDNTMREAFENCSLHDDYVEVKSLEENRKWFSAGWQAAQSVPVVGRNQCDGCNRGLQVCDDGLHREPSGHPVMACTRSEYITSIDAAIAQGETK